MFTQAFHTIQSDGGVQNRILVQRVLAVTSRAVVAGAGVAFGVIALTVVGTRLVAIHGSFFVALMALAFVLAVSFKIRMGTDLFASAALILTAAVLKGSIGRTNAALRLLNVVVCNLLGATAVAYAAYRVGVLTDTSLLEVVAFKKIQSSYVTLLTQSVLCNWSLTLAAWAGAGVPRLRQRYALIAVCFLFFLGSGYEHGVANATLLTLANLVPHVNGVTWDGALLSVFTVSLGNLLSAAIISRYGYECLRERRSAPR